MTAIDNHTPVAEEIRRAPLPDGWAWTTVGEIGDVHLGRQRSPQNRSGDHATKYLRAANITWEGLELSNVLEMDFLPREMEVYRLQLGDILLSEASGSPGEVGKPAMWNGELENCCFQNTVIRFRSELLSPRYSLCAFLHFARNGIFSRVAKGVGIHHLSADRFSAIPFLLPPQEEQLRIVAKIEELLSDLDVGVANLLRARTNLKRYRAAILNSAIKGSILDTRDRDETFAFSHWKRIGSVLVSIEQGWSPKCETDSVTNPEEWSVIKTTSIQPLKFLNFENKRLPKSLTPRPHLSVSAGDVLITRAGPRNRVGVACLVRESKPRLMVCDKVYRLRTDEKAALPAYLEIALNAPQIVDGLDELKTGISDSGVNLTQKKFLDLRIPVPTLQNQIKIIAEIERSLTIVDKIEAQVEANLKRAARLRQGILKRAFEGRLVSQDSTDEPAEQLITRIRNGRQSNSPAINGSPRSRRLGSPRKSRSATPLFAQDDGDDQGGES